MQEQYFPEGFSLEEIEKLKQEVVKFRDIAPLSNVPEVYPKALFKLLDVDELPENRTQRLKLYANVAERLFEQEFEYDVGLFAVNYALAVSSMKVLINLEIQHTSFKRSYNFTKSITGFIDKEVERELNRLEKNIDRVNVIAYDAIGTCILAEKFVESSVLEKTSKFVENYFSDLENKRRLERIVSK